MEEDKKNGERKSLYGFKVREPDERLTKNPSGRIYEIKRLWSRSHEIVQLDSMGYRGSEIANMLNIHPQTVSNTLNSQLGRELQSEVRKTRDERYEDLRDEVLELTEKSLGIYKAILENESVYGAKMLKETADTVVLNLSGLKAPTVVDSRHLHAHATLEEVEEFKRRGIEAAKASGKIVVIEESKDEGHDNRDYEG